MVPSHLEVGVELFYNVGQRWLPEPGAVAAGAETQPPVLVQHLEDVVGRRPGAGCQAVPDGPDNSNVSWKSDELSKLFFFTENDLTQCTLHSPHWCIRLIVVWGKIWRILCLIWY